MASCFVEFHVDGVARPKGSTRSFHRMLKSGRRIIQTVADNDGTLGQWQKAVATAAAVKVRAFRFTGPVAITMGFHLPHPKVARRLSHVTRPDTDKLARAVLDALTGVLWADDAQVTDLQAYKRYCGPDDPDPHVIICASDAVQEHDSGSGPFVNRVSVVSTRESQEK